MADKTQVRPGTNRGPVDVDTAKFHDNGDGSWLLAEGAHLYGWNTSLLDWAKLPVDPTSGALLVSATLAAGTVDIGKVDQGTGGASAWKVDGAGGTFPVTAAALPLPAGAAKDSTLTDGTLRVGGTVTANATLSAETTKVIGTVNQGTSPWVTSFSTPQHVVVDSGAAAVTNAGTFAVQQTKPATGTTSSPASVTTTVATVLASNAARYGATVYNESGAICYLKLGSAATLTDYTLQVAIGGYYEVPANYTGPVTGITASGTAVLRVTELTT